MHGNSSPESPPDSPAGRTGNLVGTTWQAWTCRCELLVTEPGILSVALPTIRDYLAQVELTLSRFHSNSEVRRLADSRSPTVELSPLLAEYLAVGIDVAAMTDGRVDPTVGRTAAAVNSATESDPVGNAATNPPIPGWRSLELHGTTLTMEPGTLLDLGASAKAHAADRCAAMIADEFDCGVLVNLGGDVSTAGTAPGGSWQVLVQDAPGEPSCQIELDNGAAIATSSTLHRFGTDDLHSRTSHIIDPASGVSVAPRWRTVTVAADSCVRANGLSTAAIVAGDHARDLLTEAGWPARLVATDGVVFRIAQWPS